MAEHLPACRKWWINSLFCFVYTWSFCFTYEAVFSLNPQFSHFDSPDCLPTPLGRVSEQLLMYSCQLGLNHDRKNPRASWTRVRLHNLACASIAQTNHFTEDCTSALHLPQLLKRILIRNRENKKNTQLPPQPHLLPGITQGSSTIHLKSSKETHSSRIYPLNTGGMEKLIQVTAFLHELVPIT